MKDLTKAIGYDEFWKHLTHFLMINNFKSTEIDAVGHLLNSFYMMGHPVEDYK